ncbi:MAG: PilC/PilY family type IV pilus protein, partial [Gammaproteobacteria bacterium]
PQELLVNGDKLAFQKPTVLGGDYIYGLDGTWVAWKHDPAGDGVIAADGDHVYLYGGMRRGGKNVFALDVTSVRKSSASVAPKLLWAIEGGKAGTVYEHMGQSWSTPLSRWVRWNGERRRVIFFGGGYDDVVHDDTQAFTAASHKGRQVYMVDAVTGKLLWWASGDAVADTEVPDMQYSITAQLITLDRNGNGVVDGLYAVDLAGQIFRFDFDEAAAAPEGSLPGDATDRLVAAKFVRNNAAATVAKLGATATGASTTLDNRRFYDAPGVAFVRSTAGGDLLLGVVSGYREKPLDNATQEMAVMVRDVGAWNMTPPSRAALTLADLTDATALAELSAAQLEGPGWYINFQRFRTDGSPLAEKGIGSPVFFNFALLYTTFVPYGSPSASTCTPDVGYSRLYVVNALTSAGLVNAALDNVSDNQRYLDEAMPGIGSTIQLLYSGGELTLIAGTLAMGTSDGVDSDGDGVPDQLGIEGGPEESRRLTREVFGDIRRTRWFQMNE